MIACPDVDQVAKLTEAVLDDALHWLPVRHHSPRAAAHVQATILERRPKLVFIEAPSIASDLVPHIVDKKTRPPLAIYTCYRHEQERVASWYPLSGYSPEYLAMTSAQRVKAQVVFIDLPRYALQQTADWELDYSGENQYYRALAQAAGYKSWDQAWDNLFEFGPDMERPEAFRRELTAFCAGARLMASPERLESDGTLARERHMVATIEASLREHGCGPEQAVVVCGGFHLFLDRQDPTPPPELPPGEVLSSLVPYSYFQLSELSGYASGNRAPRYFQLIWEELDNSQDELVARHTVAVLREARKLGVPASSADAISISQHANMLAALRGHHRPLLEDLQDAVMTCCCKGDPEADGVPLQRALDRAAIGTRIGRVTPALGKTPLLQDFYEQLERFEMTEVVQEEGVRKVVLDRRETEDTAASAFLHRLQYLQVPLGSPSRTASVGSATIFKEVWRLKWTPQVEATLIEANLYGDTVEAASLTRLGESLGECAGSAEASCAVLRQATLMGLESLFTRLHTQCAEALAQDQRFGSLSAAATELSLLHSAHPDPVLKELLGSCYPRACFAISGVITSPDDEHGEVVSGLKALAELVLRDREEAFDPELLRERVQSAASACEIPLLRGALLGVLSEMGALGAEEVSDHLRAYAAGSTEVMLQAGEFLSGVLSVSKTSLLLGADHLVSAIDDLLRAADWETFLLMLPSMRGGMEKLQARQRSSLAERVAQRYGLAQREEVERLQTSVGAAALFARIDAQTADLMERWSL